MPISVLINAETRTVVDMWRTEEAEEAAQCTHPRRRSYWRLAIPCDPGRPWPHGPHIGALHRLRGSDAGTCAGVPRCAWCWRTARLRMRTAHNAGQAHTAAGGDADLLTLLGPLCRHKCRVWSRVYSSSSSSSPSSPARAARTDAFFCATRFLRCLLLRLARLMKQLLPSELV